MLVVYPPSLNATTYSAAVSTPSINVSTDTPFQAVSSFDHLVTQWMSTLNCSEGRALSSSQVQVLGSSISPLTVKVHFARSTRGVGPADRTGKSLTVCWPGGTRELLSESRRRPLKPREMKANDQPPVEPAWFTEKYGGTRTSRPARDCELYRDDAEWGGAGRQLER